MHYLVWCTLLVTNEMDSIGFSTPLNDDSFKSIVQCLLCYRKGGESEDFAKRAIEGLLKKIKNKKEEIDSLIDAIKTNGDKPGTCVKIKRTLGGRLQILDKKVLAHLLYARIWRWPEVSTSELLPVRDCHYSFDHKRDYVCVNPYHLYRVQGKEDLSIQPGPSRETKNNQSATPGTSDYHENQLPTPQHYSTKESLSFDDQQVTSINKSKERQPLKEIVEQPREISTPKEIMEELSEKRTMEGLVEQKRDRRPMKGLEERTKSLSRHTTPQRILFKRSYSEDIYSRPTSNRSVTNLSPETNSSFSFIKREKTEPNVYSPQPRAISGLRQIKNERRYSGDSCSLSAYKSSESNASLPFIKTEKTEPNLNSPQPRALTGIRQNEVERRYSGDNYSLAGYNSSVSNFSPEANSSFPFIKTEETEADLNSPQPRALTRIRQNAVECRYSGDCYSLATNNSSVNRPTPITNFCVPSVPMIATEEMLPNVFPYLSQAMTRITLNEDGYSRPSSAISAHTRQILREDYITSMMMDPVVEPEIQLVEYPSYYIGSILPPPQQPYVMMESCQSGGMPGVESEELLSDAPQPFFWCTITYYEKATQIGDVFKFPSTSHSITVDGFVNPVGVQRFCLGALTNVDRDALTERVRTCIGAGIKIDLKGEGDVWVNCLSKHPIFVQSYYLDHIEGNKPGTGVHTIYPGSCVKLFDLRQCYSKFQVDVPFALLQEKARAAAFADQDTVPDNDPGIIPGIELENSEWVSIDDLRKPCVLRISFIKTWGPDYARRTIKETPCWIEINLFRPLQLLDELLRSNRSTTN